MTTKIWIGVCGFSFALGVAVGWILAGDPEVTETVIREYLLDTLITVDTVVSIDTIHTAPTIKYVPKKIHDTIFIAEKVREYETQKTFDDSAWVKHLFGIRDIDDILSYNRWDYRAAPPVMRIREVQVTPTKTEKIVKTVAWFTAGAGLTAIINNNQ